MCNESVHEGLGRGHVTEGAESSSPHCVRDPKIQEKYCVLFPPSPSRESHCGLVYTTGPEKPSNKELSFCFTQHLSTFLSP